MKTNIEMQTTLTSYLKRAGILMLALPLLITSGLRAQSTPVINWMKVQSPNLLNINGSGFGTTAGTVLLSGSPVAAVTYWSDTQISVEAGTDQTLSTTVTVTTSTGATAISVASFAATTLGGAAVDRDGSATINSVSINGGGNQAHVSPGATVTVAFDYTTLCSGGSCPIAVQLGWDVGAPEACFYANVKTGAKSLTLKAPARKGIYYILFDRNQNYCQAIWDYGTPPLSQGLGSIMVY
jgi:hypothetical protein